ncbi:hypothetical protein ANRL1_01407 [Anaerolineae bacterium]|nr:hypothetical protein ANRL1_01407 [Anaerolineae bacterium]
MEKQTAWWDQLPAQIGGDAIVANIGAGAQGVAVGKNIQQTITSILGAPTPDDRKIIEQKLGEVNATLGKLSGQIDANTAKMAEFQIKLLGGELAKTDPKETPSATTITQVGDWLLDNVPQIAESVIGLFATPAVGKVVGKAGELAIKWVKQRFGKSDA